MSEREEFENWFKTAGLHLGAMQALKIWQTATSAYDARYQARIKELGETLHKIDKHLAIEGYEFGGGGTIRDLIKEALSTTPDTALQKALLEARIEQTEYLKNTYPTDSNGSYIHSSCLVQELKELRAQLVALDKGELSHE